MDENFKKPLRLIKEITTIDGKVHKIYSDSSKPRAISMLETVKLNNDSFHKEKYSKLNFWGKVQYHKNKFVNWVKLFNPTIIKEKQETAESIEKFIDQYKYSKPSDTEIVHIITRNKQ
jgi:hypothetical protein